MTNHGNAFISFGGIDLPTKSLSQEIFTAGAGTGEQTITDLSFTALDNDIDASIDFNALSSGTATVVLNEEADTTNERQIKEWEWPTDNDSVNDEILKISIIGHGVDVRVGITFSVDQDTTHEYLNV